ncbi:polysaccharide lyase 6 family protein [Saccharicrinis sp. GN24d3]
MNSSLYNIILLMVMFGFNVQATNFTVSSASEIENVLDNLQAGDTLKMTSGIWTNEEIKFEGEGEEGRPIVLIAAEKDGVILTGTSTLRISGEYLEVNGLRFENGYSPSGAVIEFRNGSSKLASRCRLTNCSIVDYNPSDKDTDYKWVSIYSDYNRVDHCTFSGKEHSGTTVVIWLNDEPNYTQIDHNYFGARPDLGYNGGETIRIGTSTNSMKDSHAIVEYNVFEACDGEIEIISNKSCFNTYRYNTFRDCDGCLTLRHGNDCSVYGNFFFGKDKSSGGVRIIGERHQVYNNYFEGLKGDDYRSAICMMNGVPDSPLNRYFQVQDAVVSFNTIVDCKMPLIVGAGKDSEKSLPPMNCTFANNAIDKTSGNKNITIEDEPTNMTWLGNIVNANEDVEEVSTGFVFADCGLEHKDYLWRPSSSSVLIDAAQGEFAMVAKDIDGQSRNDNKDVGCDEFSDLTIEITSLEMEDVGPYTGNDENVSGIFNLSYTQTEMVKYRVSESIVCFSVIKSSYFPIRYRLYDLSGRLIKSGKLLETPTFIHVNVEDNILLARFVSGKKYYQTQKVLMSNGVL